MSVTRETQHKELTVKRDEAAEEGLSCQHGEAQGYSDTQCLIQGKRVSHHGHQTHCPSPRGAHNPRETLGTIPARRRSEQLGRMLLAILPSFPSCFWNMVTGAGQNKIIELLKLKKASKSVKSNLQPNATMTTKPRPK